MVRCFLIGAGASKACSIDGIAEMPTAPDFMKKIRAKFPYFANLVKLYGTSKGLTEVALSTDNTWLEKKIFLEDFDFEGFISYCLDETQHAENSRFVYQFSRILWNLIVEPSRQILQNQTLYDILLEDKSFEDKEKENFFINLNYDILLDNAIWSKRKNNYYEDNRKKVQYFIDYGFLFKIPNFEVNNDGILSCYKIHGSYNWAESKGSKQIIANNDYYSPEKFGRTIIPPRKIKSLELNDLLLPIYNIAEERMKTVDELIVIGCNLLNEDKHIKKLIKVFNDSNKSKFVKIVYFEDNGQKQQDYEMKIKSLFTDKIIVIFYSGGFNDDSINRFIFKPWEDIK